MSVALPIATMTLAEWDADTSHVEQHVELVHGVPTVSPPETLGNRRAVTRIVVGLSAALPPGWTAVTEIDLTIDAAAPTVRRPDVVVIADHVSGSAGRHDPADVALVAEVVSPSSVERDWVTKRAEYAAAGIPAYLVLDPAAGVLALFTNTGPGGYRARSDDGQVAQWHIAGADVVIRLTDLLPI